MKSKFVRAIALLMAATVGTMTASAADLYLTQADLNTVCAGGGILTYSGGDVYIQDTVQGYVVLNCATSITVTGGDVYVLSPVFGRGTAPGLSSSSLTLKTICGARGSNPSYCGGVEIHSNIDLSGNPGLDQPAIGSGSSANGLTGGAGGSGGYFTINAVGEARFVNGTVDVSGGNGGAGGDAGTSRCAGGMANGGHGGAAGPAGQVGVTASNIKVGIYGSFAGILAQGGAGGHAGWPASGSNLDCGSGGAGGNGANGAAGGNVKFTATNIQLSGPVITSHGGWGGYGTNGLDGFGGCIGTNCTNTAGPVNGGVAGLSGTGGNGGSIIINASSTLSGVFQIESTGSYGGDGASGGSGAILTNCADPEHIYIECCGLGEDSSPAANGGSGGSINMKGTSINYTATIYLQGGSGGEGDSITSPFMASNDPVCDLSNPCTIGHTGGHGGNGGNGGTLTLSGTQTGLCYIYLNNAGGNGGNGGNAGNNASGGVGGLKGGVGTVINNASPKVKIDRGISPTPTNGNTGTNGGPCP